MATPRLVDMLIGHFSLRVAKLMVVTAIDRDDIVFLYHTVPFTSIMCISKSRWSPG